MKLYAIISESFNVSIDKINEETIIVDLEEWDSMSHMYFITKIEESFAVELTGNEIAKMLSVRDVKQALQAKGAKDI